MANLKNSRGNFYETHRLPRDETFWLHFLEYVGLADQLAPEVVKVAKEWVPVRSNCPELTAVLEEFIKRVPVEYKALAENLFVGRIIDGEVNAGAWTKKKAGVIEISIQYMYVLTAYVAAFDEFYRLVKHVIGEIASGPPREVEQSIERAEERFQQPWLLLDDFRQGWLDPEKLVGGNVALLARVPEDRKEVQAVGVSAAESFIIAHELAHHLLGHTTSRRDKRSARLLVDRTVSGAGLVERLAPLTQNQKEEIYADILGFLIVGDCIDRPIRFGHLYSAMLGCIMTLASVAHITNEWYDVHPTSTHPGFIQRYEVIHDLVIWLTKDIPASPEEGHPMGFLGQLAKFAGLAIKHRISQALPDECAKPNILGAISSLLDFAVKINEMYLHRHLR